MPIGLWLSRTVRCEGVGLLSVGGGQSTLAARHGIHGVNEEHDD